MRANFLNGSGITDFTGAVGLDGLLVVFVGVLIIGDWLTFCLVFWSASWVFFLIAGSFGVGFLVGFFGSTSGLGFAFGFAFDPFARGSRSTSSPVRVASSYRSVRSSWLRRNQCSSHSIIWEYTYFALGFVSVLRRIKPNPNSNNMPRLERGRVTHVKV
jgi:hypothetical protein